MTDSHLHRDPKMVLDDLLVSCQAGKVPPVEELIRMVTMAKNSLGVMSSHAALVAARGIGLEQVTMPLAGTQEQWQTFLEALDAQARIMAVSAITQAGFKRDRRTTQSINETLNRSSRPR